MDLCVGAITALHIVAAALVQNSRINLLDETAGAQRETTL
jgi:hypothetical protein